MAGTRGDTTVVVVCLTDEPEQEAELKRAAGPIPVVFYDGAPDGCLPIVPTYAQALQEIDADFFVFAHQDIRGDITAWVQNALDVMGVHDLAAVIGWPKGKGTLWRDAKEPTTVRICDECCFGFYKSSGFYFDPRLLWTSYSHDLCGQAVDKGGRAFVAPNGIGHAQHRHGPWFLKSGIYQKEQAYIRAKWGDVLSR